MKRFIYFLISFIIGVFFFLVGLCAVLLALLPSLQQMAFNFIQHQSLIVLFFGIAMTLIGLAILSYGVFRKKRHYTFLKIKSDSITIDEAVIHDYLNKYWQENYSRPVTYTVDIYQKHIRIVADLPYVPMDDQKIKLDTLQRDFKEIFNSKLGYPFDIDLLISFNDQGGNSVTTTSPNTSV